MTITSATGRTAIVSRIRNILLQPTAEWRVIEHEPTSVRDLFTGYALPLAAIGPVCSALGGVLFTSATLARLGMHMSPVNFIVSAVIGYGVALLAVYVFGLVIDGLATTFGGVRDRTRAMRVAVYASTAAWLAGVFQLVPQLGFVGLVGLYSLFLLFRGLPIVMRSPPEKAVGYTVSVVLVMIVVWIVLSTVVYLISSAVGLTPNMAALLHHTSATTTTTTFTTVP